MRWLLGCTLALALTATAFPDDTKSFIDPENWQGLKEYWKIDGDVITCIAEKDPGYNNFFCSKKKYKDFELTFQVELKNNKGNSGVQIRSKIVEDPAKFIVGGPQADIGAGYWGSLYGERFGGMMKQADAKAINAKLKPNDFNDYSIKCVGKHVTIIINDVIAVDEEFEKMPEEGIIAFQLHGGMGAMQVIFKNIKFKDLSAK